MENIIMVAIAHICYALIFILHFIKKSNNKENGGLHFILIALIGILSATSGLFVGFVLQNVFNLTIFISNSISLGILMLLVLSFDQVLKEIEVNIDDQ